MQAARLKLLAFTCSCLLAFPCGLFAATALPSAKAETASLPSAPVPNTQRSQTTSPPPTRTPDQTQQTTSPSQPSLQDLGISTTQVQGNPKEQALLDKRTHMLKVHQTLGLITAIPMVAALVTGSQAKAEDRDGQTIKEPTQANLDFHIALGSLTTGLYFTTAYYAMFAPKPPGIKKRGAIRIHEALVWIHGPGMVLTPILGIMAYRQESAGEKVHGLASSHGAVAAVTAAAYGASIVAVSWPIHLKL